MNVRNVAHWGVVALWVPLIAASQVPDTRTRDSAQSGLAASSEFKPEQRALIYLDYPLDRAKLPHNSPEVMRQELTTDGFLSDFATLVGLAKSDVTKISWRFRPDDCLLLEDHGAPPGTFDKMYSGLERYVLWRLSGHTRQFVVTTFRDHNRTFNVNGVQLNPEMEELSRMPIPVSLLQKRASGTVLVNQQPGTMVTYVAMDREIVRTYAFMFSADGNFKSCSSFKVDANEHDPELNRLIEEIDEQVESQIKAEKISGLGTCHVFWQRKKAMLKERGIDWYSPRELNSDILFD